jgi:hypothetical protein
MENGAQNGAEGKLVAEEKVGSVTIPIFYSPNKAKIQKPESAEGENPGKKEFEIRTYDSYIIPYYEGSIRKTPRRSTLDKAKKFAKDTAIRLNRDGARADFLSEKDRRIYVLAKASAQILSLEVDGVCRKFVELQKRIKNGTLEQAVDFFNDHGQRVRHGATNTEIYKEYLEHLGKRGAGNYHVRDVERYAGGFVGAFPGLISPIDTTAIDNYLKDLKGVARSKNNHRDGIIGYYNFAQLKGFLPQGIPHAASLTTEFRDARQMITTEAQAISLMQPDDIYLPFEMRKLLITAKTEEPRLLPSMEIKAFSGVRTEEMVRLWWVMVCEDEELIRIPDAVGKIDARRVPILPNLKVRVAAHPVEIKTQKVCVDWSIANSLANAWKRVCRKAGVPYRRNAFRNSYFTYRLVIVGDIEIVAAEGDTSAGELKKNYLSRAPVSRVMADEWFSL